MKKVFRYFSIFVFLVSLLFINPDVRANFAESFTQVVDSLRGVERRADVINVVQPPEIEIDLTNTQSEAVNLPQLLAEFNISPINYESGTCNADEYSEKHAAFAQMIIDGLNLGENQGELINRSYDFDLNRVEGVMNEWVNSNPLTYNQDDYFAFLSWKNIENATFAVKIIVNGENITSNESGLSTDNYQFSFKDEIENYEVYIEITDAYSRKYKSNTVNITSNAPTNTTTTTIPKESNNFSIEDIELVDTGISLESLVNSESSAPAIFEGQITNEFRSEGNNGTFLWTAGKDTAGYRVEFNGKTVYTSSPSIGLKNLPSKQFEIFLTITLISFDGSDGTKDVKFGLFRPDQAQENQGSQENQGPTREQLEEQWSKNLTNINGFWVTNPHRIRVPKVIDSVSDLYFDGRNILAKIEIPTDSNYLIISADEIPYMQTNAGEDFYVEQLDKTFNLSFLAYPEASSYSIRAYDFPGSSSENTINFEINQELQNNDEQNNSSGEFSNPDLYDNNFKPNWISQEKERIRSEVHGPTQMYITWDGLNTREDVIKTKSFRIYANGDCISEQQSWNPAIDDDGKNDVAYVNSALIYNLPEESIVNVQVKAVGFNGVESDPLEIEVKTYREPRKNILTAGIVDSGMIVFGEYAYVYYGLDLSKPEYDSGQNNTRIYAMLCCDENNKDYLVASIFIPIPESSTCSDLLLTRTSEAVTPAFLGAKIDASLTITEFVESSNPELGLEAGGVLIGDTIFKINGEDVFGEFELASQLSQINAGEEIEVEIKRGENLVVQNIVFDTYPETLNIEGLSKATGCFDSSGMAVGVLKIEIKERFSRSQQLKSIYVLEEDKNANDIVEFQDSQYFYKEFKSDNKVYIGIDPFQDSQGVYGSHNIDLNSVKFNVYTNTQRATNRPLVVEEVKFEPETQDSPYDGTPGSWVDYYEKFGYEPPYVRGISDCCPDGGFMDIYGRMWDTEGIRTFQMDVNPAMEIPDWNVAYQKCQIVVLKDKPEVGYFWKPRSANVVVEMETPIVKKEDIYGMDTSCFFDIADYNSYKYVAWRTNVCYVNEDGKYFCMAQVYQAIAREQYIFEFES